MPEYRIIWEINIEATSAEEAARQALAIQRNPKSIATVFRVYDPDYETASDAKEIDLCPWERDEC